MNQPSFFDDAVGTPLFSGTPIKAQETQAGQVETRSPDNLPLLSGRPDTVILPSAEGLPISRLDLRTGIKPQ